MTSPSPPHLYDDEYDDDDDQNDVVEDDHDNDVDDDSTSSADPPPPSAVTVAIAGVITPPQPKQTPQSPPLTVNAERKALPLPIEESRKLFQRLWTDEDEIELLKGFLDYNLHRGSLHSHNSHHDTSAFYDLIKTKLQLDFNKNQLVEKLRRLKKKYRNVLSKISSGKEYVFKTSHDQLTFEISKKIWGNVGGVSRELDDDEGNVNLNVAFTMEDGNNGNLDGNGDCSGGKAVRPRKRSRVNVVKVEEKQIDQTPPIMVQPQSVALPAQGLVNTPLVGTIPNLIEETVRSCLSPLFKELLNNAMTGSCAGGMINSIMTNSMMGPLGIGGVSMNFAGGDMDDKWRKQQILELEVYSKRLELIQDQIKSQLEELRSMAN
ncbi:putative transcription factor At5g28040 [Apium graveolens]|uniref:putative transcription factor At5g28040 n=1 Tax=Apium graveolens TaxID=4045 RepID=UPI003D7A8D6F